MHEKLNEEIKKSKPKRHTQKRVLNEVEKQMNGHWTFQITSCYRRGKVSQNRSKKMRAAENIQAFLENEKTQ